MNDKRQIPEPDACVINWANPMNRDKQTFYRIFVTGNKGEGHLLRFWLAVEDNECVSFEATPGVLPFRGVGRGWHCDKLSPNQGTAQHRIAPRGVFWSRILWRKPPDGLLECRKDWVNPDAPNDMRPFHPTEKKYAVNNPGLKVREGALEIRVGLVPTSDEIDYLTQIPALDGDPQYRFRLGEGSRVPPVRGSKLAKALWSIRQAGRTEITAKELETVIRQGLSLL